MRYGEFYLGLNELAEIDLAQSPCVPHSFSVLPLSAMCSMEDGKNMAGLLDTTSYHTDVNLREKFLAIPEVQRLHHAFAAEGIEYFLVGGAVRDLLCDCADVKDIDCHVKASRVRLLEFAARHYESEVKVQPLAVTVGTAGTVDAIDLVPFNLALYDRNYVECDVNSLAFHLESATVVDVFSTGYYNVLHKRMRIPADSLEVWYSAKFPGRANNGKVPRLFKMLAKGFKFHVPGQEDAFIQICIDKFDDLIAPTTAGTYSALQVVLGMTIRGDTFVFGGPCNGQVTVGTDPSKVAKYECCLESAVRLDSRLAIFRGYMEGRSGAG